MTITWKPIKQKHKMAYIEMLGRTPKTNDREWYEFLAGRVDTWDFIDTETGEPIPAGDWGELTDKQGLELLALFAAEITGQSKEAVKKKTQSSLSSGSTKSKQASQRRGATYPNGSP